MMQSWRRRTLSPVGYIITLVGLVQGRASDLCAQVNPADSSWRVVSVGRTRAPWSGPAVEVAMEARRQAAVLWLWGEGWRTAQRGIGWVPLVAESDGMGPAAGRWTVCPQWDAAARRCMSSWVAYEATLEVQQPWPWRVGDVVGRLTVVGGGSALQGRRLVVMAHPNAAERARRL